MLSSFIRPYAAVTFQVSPVSRIFRTGCSPVRHDRDLDGMPVALRMFIVTGTPAARGPACLCATGAHDEGDHCEGRMRSGTTAILRDRLFMAALQP